MKKLTCMVVILITVAYIVVGGIIFHVLESDNESTTRHNANELFLGFLANNTCVTQEELIILLKVTAEAYRSGYLATNQTDTSSASNWDYYSAIFFSITVVTTIGYGHIAPTTLAGRIFVVLFGLVGIPLFLVTAMAIGEALYFIIRKAQKCCFHKNEEGALSKSAKVCGGLCYAIIGISLFIFVPSVIFMFVEGWTFLEGVYYCFVTLATIGFGDYVAGVEDNSNYAGFRGIYRLCLSGWIFIGISWLAGCISAIQEFYAKPRLDKDRDGNSKSSASRPNSNASIGNHNDINKNLSRLYSIDSGYAGVNGISKDRNYCRQSSYDSAYTNNVANPIEKEMDDVLVNCGEDNLTRL